MENRNKLYSWSILVFFIGIILGTLISFYLVNDRLDKNDVIINVYQNNQSNGSYFFNETNSLSLKEISKESSEKIDLHLKSQYNDFLNTISFQIMIFGSIITLILILFSVLFYGSSNQFKEEIKKGIHERFTTIEKEIKFETKIQKTNIKDGLDENKIFFSEEFTKISESLNEGFIEKEKEVNQKIQYMEKKLFLIGENEYEKKSKIKNLSSTEILNKMKREMGNKK
jgi:hypothetical protein